MTHLTVYEHKEVDVHDGAGDAPAGQFTRAQADALIVAAKVHPMGGDKGVKILLELRRSLKAQAMVGVIAAPGCSLEILPKIDGDESEGLPTVRHRLVQMLDVALGLNIGDGAAAAMARQNHSLLDIFIRLFADRLLAETRRGLPRAYLTQEDDLPTLRGRLDVARQFTIHAVRPDRLACRFDTLSSDIPLLQIMKACVIALRRHARATETIRRLDELRFVLADVSDVTVSSLPWQQVRIDRTNRRWESLFGLAALFLKRDWQATDHDRNAGQGITLLFDMNKLFENYIAALAQRAAAGTGLRVTAQGGLQNCLFHEDSGANSFQTRPDLLIKRGKQARMVIDTKWKRLDANAKDRNDGVKQGDVYQMMAYAQLYDCPEAVLLYPHVKTVGHKAYQINSSGGRRLKVATVNVTQGTEAVVSDLRCLIESAIVLTKKVA